jgi:ribonuclease T1
VLVWLLVAVLAVAGCSSSGGGSTPTPRATGVSTAPTPPADRTATGTADRTTAGPTATSASSTATSAAVRTPTAPTADRTTAAPPDFRGRTVHLAELPREALVTLELIDVGGPFPYRQDGQTFGNRERLLPIRPADHYREYTVETPGSPDRGARRIVGGADGERYFTDDHYDSFRFVVP